MRLQATHEALEASIASHMPTQLPTPVWFEEVDALETARIANGLPPQLGYPMQWKMPARAKIASW